MAPPMFGQRGEFLAKQAGLKDALESKRKGIRAIQRREQKAKKKRDSHWKLSELLKQIVLILFGLAGEDACAAAAFLEREAAKRQWPSRPHEELRKEVEDLFMAIDLDAYTTLCDASGSSEPKAMQAAMAFWQEFSLAEWVRDANMSKGVAPSTGSVLDRYERQRRLVHKHREVRRLQRVRAQQRVVLAERVLEAPLPLLLRRAQRGHGDGVLALLAAGERRRCQHSYSRRRL